MRYVLLLLAISACAKTDAVQCPDGRTCPASTECYTTDNGVGLCVTHDQLTECQSLDDGADCSVGLEAGLCRAQVCLPAGCNDGFQRGEEQCDGTELGSASDCTDLGFYYSKPLTCNSACSYATELCAGTCGDNIVDPGFELCDGAPPAIGCSDLGYGAGFLNCDHCGPGEEECKLFGWDPVSVLPSGQYTNDLHGTSESRVFAVTDLGTVYRYDGASWRALDLSSCLADPTAINLHSVWAFDDAVLVGADNGTILRITDTTCTESSAVAGSAPLTDLWAASESDVYAVSTTGVYHFDGTSWSVASSTTGLAHLWGSGPDDIYAVGNADTTTPSAAIIHKDASGWSTVPLTGFESIASVWGSGPSDVYVGGWSPPLAPDAPTVGELRHFNGVSWSTVMTTAAPPAPLPFEKVTAGFVAGSRVYVAGQLPGSDDAGVLEYDGENWVDLLWPSTAPYVTSVWVSPVGALFGTTASRSRIYHFPGSMRVDTQLGGDPVVHISVHNSGDVYAVTNDGLGASGGQVFRWDGTVWVSENGPSISTTRVADVSVAPDGTTYLIESTIGLWRRTGPGAWTLDSNATQAKTNNRVWTVGANNVWLFDNTAGMTTISHWTGSAFAACATCTLPSTIQDISGVGANDIYVVGDNQLFAHWDGNAWTVLPSPATLSTPQSAWTSIGRCGNDIYIGAAQGKIEHYDGATWSDLSLPTPVDLRSLWCTSSSDVFAGTVSGYLYWFDGVHWSPVKAGTTLNVEAGGVSGDSVFFSDQEGGVHRLIRTADW